MTLPVKVKLLLLILVVSCQTPSKEVKTSSGLSYVDVAVGRGDSPTKGDKLSVHYIGKLENGTVFDNSYDRGFPIQFFIGQGQVIKGWDEGLLSMNVGGKRTLRIPYQLGYGTLGSLPAIPPKTNLIFEVELLAIEKRDFEFNTPGKDEKTDSGIMMIIHREGKGEKPIKGQSVEIHFTGMLHTGKVFDSTHNKGATYKFILGNNSEIKGWEEAIYLMREGEKRTVIIPPALAFGDEGKGQMIPPDATLIYELELVNVQ